MFEPWLRIQQSRSSGNVGVIASVCVHALLLTAAVHRTTRPVDLPGDTRFNRAYYLAPPNGTPQRIYSPEHLEYIELPVEGASAGIGQHAEFNRNPLQGATADARGDRGREYVTTPDIRPIIGDDSVYTQIQVDSEARYDGSAAPEYPLSMLKKAVQGTVRVQFVVDTLGYADTTSLRVLIAPDSAFVRSIRAALPSMRFSPARIGSHPVRELVQQDFTFRINFAEQRKLAKKGTST